MDIPANWISETELAAATGAADRKRFHRNLLNWRHHGLLPERYDGISVADAIRHLGVGVGNEACYPPVYLPMVGRINELRARSRNMEAWLWALWLDPAASLVVAVVIVAVIVPSRLVCAFAAGAAIIAGIRADGFDRIRDFQQ